LGHAQFFSNQSETHIDVLLVGLRGAYKLNANGDVHAGG
jgi:hypothetical protein